MTLWVGLGGIIGYPPINPKKPLTIDGCDMTTTTYYNMTSIVNSTTMPTTLMENTTLAEPLEDRLVAVNKIVYGV